MKTTLCLLALCASAFAADGQLIVAGSPIVWMEQPYAINGTAGKMGVRGDGVMVWKALDQARAEIDKKEAETKSDTTYTFSNPELKIDLRMPIYNRIVVADWFTLDGKKADNADKAQAITFAGQGDTLNPEHVRITSKQQPVVAKNPDGTWTITFKP